MLDLRPNCECCDRDLPPESPDARICTFECTFCADCVDSVFRGACPNCGGGFTARPIRPANKLAKFPASTDRVLRDGDCLNIRAARNVAAGTTRHEGDRP